MAAEIFLFSSYALSALAAVTAKGHHFLSHTDLPQQREVGALDSVKSSLEVKSHV